MSTESTKKKSKKQEKETHVISMLSHILPDVIKAYITQAGACFNARAFHSLHQKQ